MEAKKNQEWEVINHGGNPMNLTDKQYAVFIGRFQPLHNGHISLFRQKLDKGIPVLVMVRNLKPDEKNPFTTEQTMDMLRSIFYKKEDLSVMNIPDIESVNWGRGVGYELNEFIPPADIASISATTIRNEIKEGKDGWKEMVDPEIHDDIVNYMKINGFLS
jgi:cytidyltransferase-like protein